MAEKLNWPARELQGSPVYLSVKDLAEDARVKERDGLAPGMAIFVPDPLWAGRALWFAVQASDDGGLVGVNGQYRAWLSFGEDERQCWTCPLLMNAACLKLSVDP